MITTDQIKKLPKWAQTELTNSQQTIDTLIRELKQYQGATISPIERRDPVDILGWLPMPDTAVRFKLGEFHSITVQIKANRLDLNSSTGRLSFSPEVANHCLIDVTRI